MIRRVFLLPVAVGGIVVAMLATATAQSTPDADPRSSLQNAEGLFNNGNLTEAEPLFRAALQAINAGKLSDTYTEDCLTHLVAIYMAWDHSADAFTAESRLYDYLAKQKKFPGPEAKIAHAKKLQNTATVMAKLAELLGDDPSAIASIDKALSVPEGKRRDDPAWEPELLSKKAFYSQRQGNAQQAHDCWRRAKAMAAAAVAEVANDNRLTGVDARCTQVVAACCTAEGSAAEGIEALRRLFTREIARHEAEGAARTLEYMATLSEQVGNWPDAQKYAEQALETQQRLQLGSNEVADLLCQLGRILQTQGQHSEAQERCAKAAAIYKALASQPAIRPSDRLRLQVKLRNAYRDAGESTKAIEIARAQVNALHRTDRLQPAAYYEAISALGMLYARDGAYADARPFLVEALNHWETRIPPVPDELATATNNLAVVEQAVGHTDEALKLLVDAHDMIKKRLGEDDPRLADSFNNLASAFAAKGNYAQAIDLYESAIRIAQRHGRGPTPVLYTAQLNMALAYKSQGLLDQAIAACKESLQTGQGLYGDRDLSLAASYDALASLCILRNKWDEGVAYANKAKEICEQAGHGNDPIAEPALNQLAMISFLKKDYEGAGKLWGQAAEIEKQSGQKAEEARILTSLGKVALRSGRIDDAEKLYRRAIGLQASDPRFPTVRYMALCDLAQILHHRGHTADAESLVTQAIGIIEAPRAGVAGDESQRAAFFFQYASAFDMLVDWSLERGDVAEALAYAERGRNRTFLDQLQLAGVDLIQKLQGPKGEELKKKEQLARQRLTEAISRRHAAFEQGDIAARDSRLKELQQAEKEYAEIWAKIRSASPVYRELLAANDSDAGLLPTYRDKVLNPRNLMLVYYLGAERSYLLLIGSQTADAKYYSLTVPASLAKTLDVSAGPLTRGTANKLVTDYVAVLSRRASARGGDDSRSPSRAIPTADDQGSRSEIFQTQSGAQISDRGSALAAVLLPVEVQQTVLQRRLDSLFVVPDGALHQLPFEALEIGSSARERQYLLDVFPPIAYAPSATILASLTMRQAPREPATLSLLSVGNPLYRANAVGPMQSHGRGRRVFEGLGGDLAPLLGTADESRRVVAAFPRGTYQQLLEEDATEANVRKYIGDSRFVHLATHGLVNQGYENLFGAIALTPPALGQETPENDGFLLLHEIYGLNLSRCELAVLSACQTNVGPDRPLEAGSTLARAFLAAGARRVVSSHWDVDDESTAELIGTFFEAVAKPMATGAKVSYAAALQQARKKVRNNPKWAAPFYWAPFVLIGPAQ